MRGNGWAWWWIGAAAASLAFGTTLLRRPESSPDAARAQARDFMPERAALGRGLSEPPSPLGRMLPSAAQPPMAPTAPPGTLAAQRDSAVTSSIRVEAPSTVSATVPPGVAPTLSATTPHVIRRSRRVSLARLAAWSQPGLCSTSEDAAATREKLTASFRHFDGGEQGQLYIDPRLPEGIESGLLPLLALARTIVARRLGLQPQPPPTYVYFDQQLMKAAACINEDVVAFYDGALHLVTNRSDLQQSVTHELTHHALFSTGLSGPAWAQEGIAMLVAQETWWQAPARLQALARMPFSPEQMEELIPYKLPSDQAVGFYVQAALTVQCLLTLRGWSLQQLADTLRNGSGPDSVSYDLPELQSSSFVGGCVTKLGG